MIRLLPILPVVLLVACTAKPLFHGVQQVSVSLVSADGTAGLDQTVDASHLAEWSACLERTTAISTGAAIKSVLIEGEYRIHVKDDSSDRVFTLHNRENLTDSSANFYRTDCLYKLVKGQVAAPAPADPPADPPAAKQVPPSPAPNSAKDYDALVRGQTLDQLKARYGEPTSTLEFKMGDGIPEFRVELLNTYRPGDGHDDVQILEHTYRLDGYRFTIWYHERQRGWIGLEAVSYNDDVEF